MHPCPSALALACLAMTPAMDLRAETGAPPDSASVHGFDLSHWQGSAVGFAGATASKNTFVFVKATQGARGVDADHAANVQRARAAGLSVGSYHFFDPGHSPHGQFANIRSHICLQPGDLPPVVDIERLGPDLPAQRSADLHGLLSRMALHYGVKPILYAGEWFASEYLSGFDDYPLWMAEYRSATTPAPPSDWPRWTFWQYTQDGRVKGIPGRVDLSRFNGTPDDFQRLLAPRPPVSSGHPCPPGLPSGKGRACDHAAACSKEPHVHLPHQRFHHDRGPQ